MRQRRFATAARKAGFSSIASALALNVFAPKEGSFAHDGTSPQWNTERRRRNGRRPPGPPPPSPPSGASEVGESASGRGRRSVTASTGACGATFQRASTSSGSSSTSSTENASTRSSTGRLATKRPHIAGPTPTGPEAPGPAHQPTTLSATRCSPGGRSQLRQELAHDGEVVRVRDADAPPLRERHPHAGAPFGDELTDDAREQQLRRLAVDLGERRRVEGGESEIEVPEDGRAEPPEVHRGLLVARQLGAGELGIGAEGARQEEPV